jgi:hypothetical protein
MLNVGFSILIFLIFGYSLPTLALTFKESWDPVPGASSYEYEMSQGTDFNKAQIVKTGRVDKTQLELELEAGTYFFRLRAIAKEGIGDWTAATRVSLVDPIIKIIFPNEAAKIPLLSVATPLVVEWKSLGDKVDDYSLQLEGPQAKRMLLFSTRHQLEVPHLSPGRWKITVLGRKKGSAIYSSPAVNVELLDASTFTPKIITPVDGENIPEFAEFDLRWIRKIPGKKTEILLARADQPGFPVIWRENFISKTNTVLQGLAVGRYQLTVRDYDSIEKESTEQTITILVVDNPRDTQPENLGITARILRGAFFGYKNVRTPSMWGNSANYSTFGAFQLEGRLTWKFSPAWGAESHVGTTNENFQFRSTSFSGVTFEDPNSGTTVLNEINNNSSHNTLPSDRFLRLGVMRKSPLKNQNLDLWLKLYLHYRYLRAPLFDLAFVNSGGSPTLSPTYTMTNYGQFGLAIGGELHWKIRPWTELSAEATLPLPIFAESGPSTPFGRSRAGTGKFSEFYMPELRLEFFLRRKFSREFRLLVGAVSQIGFTSVREKAVDDIFTDIPPGRRTRTTEFSLSPRLGVDWDF